MALGTASMADDGKLRLQHINRSRKPPKPGIESNDPSLSCQEQRIVPNSHDAARHNGSIGTLADHDNACPSCRHGRGSGRVPCPKLLRLLTQWAAGQQRVLPHEFHHHRHPDGRRDRVPPVLHLLRGERPALCGLPRCHGPRGVRRRRLQGVPGGIHQHWQLPPACRALCRRRGSTERGRERRHQLRQLLAGRRVRLHLRREWRVRVQIRQSGRAHCRAIHYLVETAWNIQNLVDQHWQQWKGLGNALLPASASPFDHILLDTVQDCSVSY
ncbi:uncharacterized protein B0I36DRAFT_382658 [Microdochium trichocladiopsis]|uniref:Uncharacterized protein n=1 Tax=Microdochium trichocladiopsis TaxID=1682393 RepID=A0A9P8Y8F2_9PEZI|nr:uncharacterized protein B0I36DRAFT_382658 [Microdochium trichocladiopsis]KAH7032616.1 hypothetical protein B0I36DRAFT_382658 [Microdochium trichocladiopsis]